MVGRSPALTSSFPPPDDPTDTRAQRFYLQSMPDGGPSLRQLAGLIQQDDPVRAAVPQDDVDEFLRGVALNAALGNGDAHAKNIRCSTSARAGFGWLPCTTCC